MASSDLSRNTQPLYRFKDFVLNPSGQALTFCGTPVALGGRAFDILTLLVERAGEVVGRDEIFARVWPGLVVHEHNLKVNVGNLRRALAGVDPHSDFVATIAGRGYKFVALVEGEMPLSANSRIALPGSHVLPPTPPFLFGREEAIKTIILKTDLPGYVTVVGPGGAGKTSIAIECATRAGGSAEDVAFADLAALNDPRFVVPALAAALGVSMGLDDPIAGVIDELSRRKLIFVVDNCEHVIVTIAALIERIAAASPDARIIATSREPLRTRSEHPYFLERLPCPDPQDDFVLEDALASPAVQLFLARVGHQTPQALEAETAKSIVAVCSRVDGLALAIELAAGTAGGPAMPNLKRLKDGSLGEMRRGPRDSPLRHQTLQATLDWSFRLLPDTEALLLSLLSVFTTRFTSDDAEAIYAAGEIDATAGRDALGQLVAKSLVSANARSGTLTYRLVESTWTYASQRLITSDCLDAAKRHFAERILDKLTMAEREWPVMTSREWLRKHRDQIHDLRSALGWAFGPEGNERIGTQLVVAGLPLWQELSLFKEMLAAIGLAQNSTAFSTLSPISASNAALARAWAMTLGLSMHADTDKAWQESNDCAERTANLDFLVRSIFGQAVSLTYSGRPIAALRAIESFIETNDYDPALDFDGTRLMGHIEVYAGRLPSARTRLDGLLKHLGNGAESTAVSRFQVDLPVAVRFSLSLLCWLQGEHGRASTLAEQAIRRAVELDHMISLGNALSLTGLPLSFLVGDFDEARRRQQMLAGVTRRENVGIYVGTSEFFAGALAAQQGDPAGLSVMERSIDALNERRWRARLPFYAALLAEAWLTFGHAAQAELCLRKALAFPWLRQEPWCHPELHRVAGLVLIAKGQPDAARRHFRISLRMADRMGASGLRQRTEASIG